MEERLSESSIRDPPKSLKCSKMLEREPYPQETAPFSMTALVCWEPGCNVHPCNRLRLFPLLLKREHSKVGFLSSNKYTEIARKGNLNRVSPSASELPIRVADLFDQGICLCDIDNSMAPTPCDLTMVHSGAKFIKPKGATHLTLRCCQVRSTFRNG